jgi:hypothetical protein
MPRGRRATFTVLAIACAATLLAACSNTRVLDSVWPEAIAERSVQRPPGPAHWPLTGLDATNPQLVRQRIVSVKVENSAQARPQSNLDQADLVYETVTEGGITRFNALYQSLSPRSVAPVRSARTSDLSIVPEYQALFAHVGGAKDVLRQLKNHSKYNDVDQLYNPAPYRRGKDRVAPHNVYVDVVKLRDWGISKLGYESSAAVRPFPFDRSSVAGTPTATFVSIPFSSSNKATWAYNAKTNRYARSTNGTPHKDKVSNKQYTASNVVVMWATIRRLNERDANGSPVFNVVLTGKGRVTIFRNGRRFDGTWSTPGSVPPTFRAKNGTVLRLTPGNSWFEVIGNDQHILFK